jgi:hypothetical protein
MFPLLHMFLAEHDDGEAILMTVEGHGFSFQLQSAILSICLSNISICALVKESSSLPDG